MRTSLVCGVLFSAISMVAAQGVRGAVVQWSTGDGGNGHYYELVNTTTSIDFPAAETAAAAMSYNGVQGRLAVFENDDYAAEEAFVFRNVYLPYHAADNLSIWLGAYNLTTTGADRYSSWFWLDGSNVATSITTGWNIDLNEGEGYEGATFYSSNSPTIWDYKAIGDPLNIGRGYIVEYAAIPEPTMLAPLAIGGLALLRRKR